MEAAKESDVVDAVRDARSRNAPIEIVGNGTKRGLGNSLIGEQLDVSQLAGIISYEPEELVLTAKPATTLTELAAVLESKNQKLGFEPPEWAPFFGSDGSSTLGGAISVDAAGPARLRYGGARDHLLGIRAVNGLGESFKAGGRVVKNVTGFDIPKIICGGFGTLCVLTELTLRVYPEPPLSATLVVRDIAPEDGLALLRRFWSSPLECSGLSYLPAALSGRSDAGAGVALIRLDGAKQPLEEKLSLARSILAGRDVVSSPDANAPFTAIGDGKFFQASVVWRAYVPPAHAYTLLRTVEPYQWLADWAGGLLWIGLKAHDSDAQTRLKSALVAAGGQGMLMRADDHQDGAMAFIEPKDEGREMVTRSVKAAFDPDFLLNRGRMFEGF